MEEGKFQIGAKARKNETMWPIYGNAHIPGGSVRSDLGELGRTDEAGKEARSPIIQGLAGHNHQFGFTP